MASKNLEKMTLDELIEHRVSQKNKIRELQEEYEESGEIYRKRVQQFHIETAANSVKEAARANGVSLQEQIRDWAENGDAGQRKQANLVALNLDSIEREG